MYTYIHRQMNLHVLYSLAQYTYTCNYICRSIYMYADFSKQTNILTLTSRTTSQQVIEARGELKAAQILLNAANTMQGNQSAMQLRFLQTLTNVSAENNRTIIMPYPSEITDGSRGGGGSAAAQRLLTSAVSALAAQDGSSRRR
jgi:hypothetical protein